MSYNIYETVNALYKKEPITIPKIDVSLCIALTNILKLDTNNLTILKKLTEYLFYLEPKRYIMLLFILLPQKIRVPFLKKIEKVTEEKEDKLYNKIGYVLDWSKKELNIYKFLLDKIIDRDYWCKELACKN